MSIRKTSLSNMRYSYRPRTITLVGPVDSNRRVVRRVALSFLFCLLHHFVLFFRLSITKVVRAAMVLFTLSVLDLTNTSFLFCFCFDFFFSFGWRGQTVQPGRCSTVVALSNTAPLAIS